VLFVDSSLPLAAEVTDRGPASAPERGDDSLALDYDALSSAASMLQLRAKAHGDRICLPGMDGSKKLQDLFVDEKIPREKRPLMPVVATENDVLWIPGVRRSRLYSPTTDTRRFLILSPARTDSKI
jgi:tRNA(Ile)-lysidine synthase